jgi:uncharacterized protein YrrD
MLKSVSHLNGATIHAMDGDIGMVSEVYFDDEKWVIRYLVVDTGSWLAERKVLISPYAVMRPIRSDEPICLMLSRRQVENSPDVDTHQPVSRRHEREVLRYYSYPDYWAGADLWGAGGLPLLPMVADVSPLPSGPPVTVQVPAEDVHLRSSADVKGYDIQTTDDNIGHVVDFIFDEESWALRYLVVDTSNWWPGGRKVLISPTWIKSISWDLHSVSVRMTREQLKNSLMFDESLVLDRDYEQRLHAAYGEPGYWDIGGDDRPS